MRVFLDDVRDPPKGEWVVCRSVAEMQQLVKDMGFPSHVSFDHDLGDNVPSGKDAANWLIEQDLDHNVMPEEFTFQVHSANPPGAKNIHSVMDNYLLFRASERTIG